MTPSLSGIGLLSNIMSHQTYKHIPVIMMSSHDSMVLIFKCLSMGAVDFLIKPLRKNELKNIWKHVWKRHQNSSASCCGGISSSQTQNVLRLQNAADPKNNADNKEEELELQYEEIQRLLAENRRLASTHVELCRELAAVFSNKTSTPLRYQCN